jgi:hypothetical protein
MGFGVDDGDVERCVQPRLNSCEMCSSVVADRLSRASFTADCPTRQMPTIASFSTTGSRRNLMLAHQIGGLRGRHVPFARNDAARDDLRNRTVEWTPLADGAHDMSRSVIHADRSSHCRQPGRRGCRQESAAMIRGGRVLYPGSVPDTHSGDSGVIHFSDIHKGVSLSGLRRHR